MRMLSRQAYAAAHNFVLTQGRPLDQARWQFHFAGGSAAAVLTELARFQNGDGGFGHALEPDLRTPASSAIATAQALALLREIAATGQEPLIHRAVHYLLRMFDQTQQVWPIVPPAVEDAPHAPWWTYAATPQNFGGFVVNPTAAIVGLLSDYPDLLPPDFLGPITTRLITRLEKGPDQVEMHDFHCYMTLAQAPNLPVEERQRLQARLRQIASQLVERDPTKWGDYTVLPLDVVPTPTLFLADVMEASVVQANLDFLIERQLPDGSWPIPWSWAFVDEQAWAQAEKDWQGFLVINHLRVLQAYQRIEGLNAGQSG